MHFPCVIGLGLLGLSIFYLTDMVPLMQYCYISCFASCFCLKIIYQLIRPTSRPTGWGIALDKVNIIDKSRPLNIRHAE